MSLADQANDQGICWPSVRTIATRTCLSERAVQNAIKALIEIGLVSSQERRGSSSMYQITPADAAPPQEMRPADAAPHPRSKCTPPPQELHPTPADAAPKPTKNRKEPKKNRKPSAVVGKPKRPSGVGKQTWSDWLALRKQLKAPVTRTALDGIQREAERAGITLERALQIGCANGWRGFRASWVAKDLQSEDAVNNGVGVHFT